MRTVTLAITMKRVCIVFLGATAASAMIGPMVRGSMAAARSDAARVSAPETPSDVSGLRVPDPHKELRHLSKNLKLNKDQRADVGIILEERAREIDLLLDIKSLSEDYRNALAGKVIKDSDVQIELVLRGKQKRKFDKELTKDRDNH
jgi:hypothetical protein